MVETKKKKKKKEREGNLGMSTPSNTFPYFFSFLSWELKSASKSLKSHGEMPFTASEDEAPKGLVVMLDMIVICNM